MKWLTKRLSVARRADRDRREAEYAAAPTGREQRLELQLEAFARVWRETREHVPFYRDLVARGQAPRELSSWTELAERFPAIDRQTLYQNLPALTDQRRPPEFFRVTGGSTGSPVQLPAWNAERGFTTPDIWRGRGWYGIEPSDRLFMIWGHRHLLGKGLAAFYRGRRRVLQDRLRGYVRFPAYDLSQPAMERAFKVLSGSDADYMIGYSVAVDRFARANAGRTFTGAPLKAVIATAESYPFDDSAATIQALLSAPTAMEYGAVETNLIAHTHPEGGFRAFFKNYFLEAVEKRESGGYALRITSLYPRCFPLIRYEIGDELELDRPTLGAFEFKRVIGRCNAYLEFEDGHKLHSETVTHCLSGVAALSGYQLVKTGEKITLRVTLKGRLEPAEAEGILERLKKIDPRLASVKIEAVEKLEQAKAGKTPMVINRP